MSLKDKIREGHYNQQAMPLKKNYIRYNAYKMGQVKFNDLDIHAFYCYIENNCPDAPQNRGFCPISYLESNYNYLIEQYVDWDSYNNDCSIAIQQNDKKISEFEKDFYEEFDIQNHPKKDLFFSVCVNEASSDDFADIYYLGQTLIKLIKD